MPPSCYSENFCLFTHGMAAFFFPLPGLAMFLSKSVKILASGLSVFLFQDCQFHFSRIVSVPFPGLSVSLFQDCQCSFSRTFSVHAMIVSVLYPGRSVLLFLDAKVPFSKTAGVPFPVLSVFLDGQYLFLPGFRVLKLQDHWCSFPGMSMFLL